jgi:hypothetical protein
LLEAGHESALDECPTFVDGLELEQEEAANCLASNQDQREGLILEVETRSWAYHLSRVLKIGSLERLVRPDVGEVTFQSMALFQAMEEGCALEERGDTDREAMSEGSGCWHTAEAVSIDAYMEDSEPDLGFVDMHSLNWEVVADRHGEVDGLVGRNMAEP